MTLRDTAALIGSGLLDPSGREAIEAVAARYAIAITPAMRASIETPDDPIGRQFVPSPSELIVAPHEHPDPIGDGRFSPVKGVVHRYADRALLKPLLICPIYCRFCFRREHVGPDGGLLTEAELDAAFAWFASHPSVTEVILTGGDPLMLSPRRLRAIVARLAAMPHIATIRVHTRVPTTDPDRVTDALVHALTAASSDQTFPPMPISPAARSVATLGASPEPLTQSAADRTRRDVSPRSPGTAELSLWLVLHANHAREFGVEARAALARLRRAGIPLLGQSVLLRGVNDSAAALEALFRAMISASIKPYYLHQLDPAPGTARFHVPIEEGRRLLAALRGRVTGLAWPTYVLDIPGGHGKVPIGPDYLDRDGSVRDPAGQKHAGQRHAGHGHAGDEHAGDGLPGHGLAGHGLAGHEFARHGLAEHGLAGHEFAGHGLAEHGYPGHGYGGHGHNVVATEAPSGSESEVDDP
jgi:lysine 2,3-aminomutase